MVRRKNTEYYVNNKELLEAMTSYKERVIYAKEHGKPKPRVSNYVGDCFLKIATHLSYKPNFVNYPFREDMICDGIENCLQYIDNFDPEKSSNPFAYFTQIIYYAFLRRIQKEKKQLEIKQKILDHSDAASVMQIDDSGGTAGMSDMNSIKENIEIRDESLMSDENALWEDMRRLNTLYEELMWGWDDVLEFTIENGRIVIYNKTQEDERTS